MGITCKLNWENLHVISSQKKIIWESLVKWTQIKFKGKSNERKREISKKEKEIEERKEKKRLASLARAVLGKAIQLFQYAAVQTLAAGFQALCANFIVTDGWWWWWWWWWMVVVVDGGGGSKKKFFNFAETWHTGSSRYINVHNFRVLVKQLSYGNEIQFQV